VSSSTSDDYRKKVYTKFGDSGETSLLYGGRISKNSPNTEAYGITDEAVSVMGLARAMTSDERVNDMLRQLQRELFTIAVKAFLTRTLSEWKEIGIWKTKKVRTEEAF